MRKIDEKYNEYRSYICPCGLNIENIELLHPHHNTTYRCECGSEWEFNSCGTRKIKSKYDKLWPKFVRDSYRIELLNRRPFTNIIKNEIKRLVNIYSYKFAYFDKWNDREMKTWLSEQLFECDSLISSYELEFKFGNKLDRINLKLYSSTDNTDEEILKNLKLFEEHIIYYMKEGKLSKEYKDENFYTYEIEEVTSIENWM